MYLHLKRYYISFLHTYIHIYIYRRICFCLFVLVFLPNGESDCHRIQSVYSVHHGKETDGVSFDRLSIGAPLGFVVPSLFEEFHFLSHAASVMNAREQQGPAFDPRTDVHLNGQNKAEAI